jgi:D-ribose pyranose/furanose isomerase RbsD
LQYIPAYKKIQQLGSSVLNENVEVAEVILKEEAHLMELHKEVTSLQSSLQAKLTVFEAMEHEQYKLCAPYDWRQVLKQLEKATKKAAMDESEAYPDDRVGARRGRCQ